LLFIYRRILFCSANVYLSYKGPNKEPTQVHTCSSWRGARDRPRLERSYAFLLYSSYIYVDWGWTML